MRLHNRANLNGVAKLMPNGVIHIFIIMLLPFYVFLGVFKYGLLEAIKEWWEQFFARYEFFNKPKEATND